MAVAVEVPKLGNSVEECLIAKWRKHKGEAVSAGLPSGGIHHKTMYATREDCFR